MARSRESRLATSSRLSFAGSASVSASASVFVEKQQVRVFSERWVGAVRNFARQGVCILPNGADMDSCLPVTRDLDGHCRLVDCCGGELRSLINFREESPVSLILKM